MSAMVEKVARAIWEGGKYADERASWDEVVRRAGSDPEFAGTVEDQRAIARAAIEAIKAELLKTVTTYDAPVYDDIGMQERGTCSDGDWLGDWMKVEDIVSALVNRKE